MDDCFRFYFYHRRTSIEKLLIKMALTKRKEEKIIKKKYETV